MSQRIVIGVAGASQASPAILALAEATGRAVARAGAVLACGGRGGVMEAAARGARGEGGLVLGILPGGGATGRAEANPWVELALPTGMGEMRNVLLVRASHALIAISGGYGTLSEIAAALNHGIPVATIGSWQLIRPDGERDSGPVAFGTAEDAVAWALEQARRLARSGP